MNLDEFEKAIMSATMDDLVKIYVFSDAIEYERKKCSFDVCADSKTLMIKNKHTNGTECIDIDSIKRVQILKPKKWGMDPMKMGC